MCGRFALHAKPELVAEFLSAGDVADFPPRYNIAPTQPILLAIGGEGERPNGNASGRSLQLARWGLIPSWVKDASGFPLLINARGETAATKHSFRSAMKYRRCLVPATEFYEWRREGKGASQPFLFRPADRRPFAFAALMETAIGPDGGEMDTTALITTAASGAAKTIHDRMPVTVGEPDFERWLNCRDYGVADVDDLLERSDVPDFDIVPIGPAVNKVANMGPSIQDPVERPIEGRDMPGNGNETPLGDQLRLI